MTILNEGELVVRGDGEAKQVYKIDRGIMHVRDNKVIVFLDV
jgi:F0F1-type ATP synthase epsilon subunit